MVQKRQGCVTAAKRENANIEEIPKKFPQNHAFLPRSQPNTTPSKIPVITMYIGKTLNTTSALKDAKKIKHLYQQCFSSTFRQQPEITEQEHLFRHRQKGFVQKERAQFELKGLPIE